MSEDPGSGRPAWPHQPPLGTPWEARQPPEPWPVQLQHQPRHVVAAGAQGEREELGVPGLSAVAVVVRHGSTADGRVVEVTRMTMTPGYTLVYEIES